MQRTQLVAWYVAQLSCKTNFFSSFSSPTPTPSPWLPVCLKVPKTSPEAEGASSAVLSTVLQPWAQKCFLQLSARWAQGAAHSEQEWPQDQKTQTGEEETF